MIMMKDMTVYRFDMFVQENDPNRYKQTNVSHLLSVHP